MISLIFSGYLSSIGKVLKNICRQIAFFFGGGGGGGQNIDHMKKKTKKNKTYFSLEMK